MKTELSTAIESGHRVRQPSNTVKQKTKTNQHREVSSEMIDDGVSVLKSSLIACQVNLEEPEVNPGPFQKS